MKGWLAPESLDPQAKEGRSASEEKEHAPTASRTSNAQNIAEFYRAQPVRDRRIHILGTGSVGRFIAHSLRGIPNPPPVTLIFHGHEQLKEWNSSSRRLYLITDDVPEKREGYEAELAIPRRRLHGKEINYGGTPSENPQDETTNVSGGTNNVLHGESTEPIQSLIVCADTPYVLQALSAVKHRLHPESVVMFLQNGMGTVEEVNKEIFPDPETRPYYGVGITSHTVTSIPDDPFTSVHAGFGTLCLGLMPHERQRNSAPYAPTSKFKAGRDSMGPVTANHSAEPDPDTPEPTSASVTWTRNNRYLLRTLLRTPVLCATAFSPPDLLQMQLEKLAINAIIGPLTVMLDARNGAILYNYSLTRTIRLLLSEISLVIRNLPELQHMPNIQQRFDPGRLETMVVGTAHRTRDNISNMLADVRAGRKTDVQYLNGWIVKRGEEQGIRCLMNYMMCNLVKGKSTMVQLEISENVPFVKEKPRESSIQIKGEGLADGDV